MSITMLELFRRARGWSQATLAEHLGAGFTASAISLIESQRLRPSARQQARLRELFGETPTRCWHRSTRPASAQLRAARHERRRSRAHRRSARR